ncbi:DedA family protein [Pacificimonas sp. WHA3]|uniref:DedA family protein n=1 Tax=Pacificimonas pallii TaxID=2827236 RepID=A0ABS6S9Y3_9SPHN|nr:DedA family protein [Pacificimonas pallii]MBV7255164.1 DedA family protein [Pacificimonas pallii]
MTDWIEQLIAQAGYSGIAFLMFLENLFPPIPSEVIMSLAGYAAAQGNGLSLTGVIVSGSLGSLIGMTFWYYVGRWFSQERLRELVLRHGRWLTIGVRELDRIDYWFEHGGRWAIMIGRCVPTIRTLISVPAGIFAMPLRVFLPLTFIGVSAWNAALAWLGYQLGGEYQAIEQYLGPVSLAVIAAMVAFYLWRVATFTSPR